MTRYTKRTIDDWDYYKKNKRYNWGVRWFAVIQMLGILSILAWIAIAIWAWNYGPSCIPNVVQAICVYR